MRVSKRDADFRETMPHKNLLWTVGPLKGRSVDSRRAVSSLFQRSRDQRIAGWLCVGCQCMALCSVKTHSWHCSSAQPAQSAHAALEMTWFMLRHNPPVCLGGHEISLPPSLSLLQSLLCHSMALAFHTHTILTASFYSNCTPLKMYAIRTAS